MSKLGKVLLLIIVLGGLVFFASTFLVRKPDVKLEKEISPSSSSSSEKIIDEEITASFEIYTKGTKRIFTDSKYHNLSPDVYIQNDDPSVIYVKKSGITWNDFFKTLPMKLTSECLTTGTGRLFCNGENGRLRFFINDIETLKSLEMVIGQNDRLRVVYE